MNISEKFTDKQLFHFALRVKCEQDDIPPEEVVMKTRKRHIVEARMMISKLLLKEGLTLSEIARFLNKDHATIIHYRNLHDSFPGVNQIMNTSHRMPEAPMHKLHRQGSDSDGSDHEQIIFTQKDKSQLDALDDSQAIYD